MELPDEIIRLFPHHLCEAIQSYSVSGVPMIEEIRCRIGQAAAVVTAGTELQLDAATVTAEDLDHILERATAFSYHAFADELRRGYVHTPGGCRIGVCGTLTDGGMRDVSSISFRLPHEIKGCADPVISELMSDGPVSALIVSPPGGGKTTLLRDLIRLISLEGYRVAVADERGELASVHRRKPQFDLGPHTDVMSAGSKHAACMMLIRSMNPQVLALDEITEEADAEAVLYAAGCGVALLAAAHATGANSLNQRPLYRKLLAERIFKRAVEIRKIHGHREYRVITL